MLNLDFKVRSQREKGEEVEGELQRQLARLKGEVVQLFSFSYCLVFHWVV